MTMMMVMVGRLLPWNDRSNRGFSDCNVYPKVSLIAVVAAPAPAPAISAATSAAAAAAAAGGGGEEDIL